MIWSIVGLYESKVLIRHAHLDIGEALQRYVPHAAHQRCTVHHLRNAPAHVSSDAWKHQVRDGLRDVWGSAHQ